MALPEDLYDKTDWSLKKENTTSQEKEIVGYLYHTQLNFTEEDIFNFLKIRKRWYFNYNYEGGNPATVRIINQLGYLHALDMFEQRWDGIFLNFDKWHKYYSLGYTTVIGNVLDLNPELRKIENYLTEELGIMCCGNFYFGKYGRRASFGKHHHPYDVIVKQIYGSSRWIVNEKEVIVNPQDVLFIPRKTDHEVIDKGENKLSLTLNIE